MNLNNLKVPYYVCGAVFFTYILVRAIFIGITYDEYLTIKTFVPLSIYHIINYTPADTNNHILYTLLSKLFLFIFNDSLFVARLTSVIASLIYMYFSFKISRAFFTGLSGIICFNLLLLNPFLLDFFSIARGYGLALSFQMASIYFLLRFVREKQIKSAVVSLVFGGLSTLSGFSLLNYFISLLPVVFMVSVLSKDKLLIKKTVLYSLAASLILLAVIYEPIRKLNVHGMFYYGGGDNFYKDTLLSLAKYTFYSPFVTSNIAFALNGFLVVFGFVLVLSLINYARTDFIQWTIVLVTLLCVLSVILQNKLFGTLYLIDRTALFFYPMLILSLMFLLNNSFNEKISKYLSYIIVILFTINFISKSNLYKTAIWYFDSQTESTLEWVNEIGERDNKVMKVDYSWPFEKSLEYYYSRSKYPFVELVRDINSRYEANGNADYYIFLAQSLEKVGYEPPQQKIQLYKKKVVRRYDSESVLIYQLLESN